MKLESPQNNNYCATVVEIRSIVTLANCDNVVSVPIFGFSAIVSKDIKVGDIGIVFPAETQLSDEFCSQNNLYRHKEKNRNPEETGYIEDNRRIRAVKFRGNTSSCLFMPLTSLKYTGIKIEDLKIGNEFDVIDGQQICTKYFVPVRVGRGQNQQAKKESRVEAKFMPEHYSTENFFKNALALDQSLEVIVTQKLHGTSIRIGNTIVKRKKNLIEKIVKYLGVTVKETDYDYIYGSRKVIKDPNNPNQMHYYDADIWTEEGQKLKGLIPKNYLVYAELIGWTSDGAELQKNYTYGIPKGETKLYVYRVAVVNEDGFILDLSWEQTKQFCTERGLLHVPELGKYTLLELTQAEFHLTKSYLDVRYFDSDVSMNHKNAVWLGEHKELVDEGICIRIEGLTPQIFKAKSPIFLQHETSLLDKGIEDLESQESNV